MTRKTVIAASALLLALSVAYSNHFATGLHIGDYPIIRDNPAIRSLRNIPRFFYDVTTSATDPADYAFRPLVTTSLAVDYLLGGSATPLVFHVTSFLVFLAGLTSIAWLFFSIFEHTIPNPWNPSLALMGTALLGLHPAVAEILNPVSERGEMYAALGAVAGIAWYAGLPGQRRRCLYLIPPLLGILAHPSALMFGPMLLAYILLIEPNPIHENDQAMRGPVPSATSGSSEYFPKRVRIRRRKKRVRRYIKAQLERFLPAMAFTVAACGLLALTTTAHLSGESAVNYWFTEPWVALRYFYSFFVPMHLSPISDLQVFHGYNLRAVWGIVFLLVLVSVALIAAVSAHWRPAVLGTWWFLLGILPGAVRMQPQVEKDTRMFLPFIGLALGLTWTARMLLPSGVPLRRLQAILACGLLTALAYGTYSRNRVWSDEETLWRDSTAKNPGSARGWQNYALALLAKGKAAEAYERLRQARQINPTSAEIEGHLGSAAAALNQPDDAERHFRRALMLEAGNATSHYLYAVWLEKQGSEDKALEEYSRASSLSRSDLRPRYGMMRAANASADWTNLKAAVERAGAIAPDDPIVAQYRAIVQGRSMH